MTININDASHPVRVLAIEILEQLENICKADWTGTNWYLREDKLVDTLLEIKEMNNDND